MVDRLGRRAGRAPILSCQEAEMTTQLGLSEPYLGVRLLSRPASGSLALPKIVTALQLSANESLEGFVGGHILLKPF